MYKSIQPRTMSPNKTETFAIDRFLGVDYTSGDFITNYYRSPDAVNLVWGDNPLHAETRKGVERYLSSKIMEDGNEAVVWGMHVYEPGQTLLVHAGTRLFKVVDRAPVEIATGLSERPTKSFMMQDTLYIVGGGTYLQYNSSISRVTDSAFVPTTVISRLPWGGGTAYEPINLLSTRRKNSFFSDTTTEQHTETYMGDDTETEFVLVGDITSDVIKVTVNGVALTYGDEYEVNRTERILTVKTAPASGAEIKATYTVDTGEWATEYYLDSAVIDYLPIKAWVDGAEKVEGTDFTVDREVGKVVFNTAPERIGDVDNVVIQFSKSAGVLIANTNTFTGDGAEKDFALSGTLPISPEGITVEVDGLAETGFEVDALARVLTFDNAPANGAEIEVVFNALRDTRASAINNCTVFGVFGGGNDTRVFLSGNADKKNRDWQSGLYDATYFPDTGYSDIGSDSFAIMGYVKQYDTQMIIKEGSQQDGSAYLRTFAIGGDGKAYFPVEQGAVGIGAISKECFAYVQGEPLFLSPQGVVGVAGTNVDNQRLIQDRSTLVNTRLLKEPLESAVAVEHKNKYHLFVGGHVYVCDARVRYEDALGSVQYEWYYWDNLPATCAKVFNGDLLIGHGGMVFRQKTDIDSGQYIDEDYNGAQRDIKSYWVTPKLYFGSIASRKSMDFVYFMFRPNKNLNAKVTCNVDDERTVDLGEYEKFSAFGFPSLDFDRFSFGSSQTYSERATTNIRNFDNIQFTIESADDRKNTAIGLEILQAVFRFAGSSK